MNRLLESMSTEDYNEGLYSACSGGHKELAIMIARGASDWNGGLYYACEGGHKDLAELMIAKGADDWNWGS